MAYMYRILLFILWNKLEEEEFKHLQERVRLLFVAELC